MFRLQSRPAHYLVIAAAHLLMTLPNLGAHSFWDMDEGVNAEAAREMLESGNWITPHFNFEIRTAKPAMLCWLQASSYQVFGINEFGARLPSVLCGLGTVLLTYEFGRRLFSTTTGLISAIVLASCIEFCLISHAATPDPPLILFMTAAMFIYWIGSEGDRRWWFIPFGVLTALAALTKGPIGLGLPGLIILLHLLWMRRLNKLWDHWLIWGALAFIVVAVPWYGMVTLDTRGKWPSEFFMKDNVGRFTSPSEGHKGPFFLHALLLFALFAPWSVFLPAAIWYAVREARQKLDSAAMPSQAPNSGKYRFLVVWFLTVLVVFSISATKLPNYILPLYPAIAILTGRFLDQWRLGQTVPSWVVRTALIITAITGVIIGGGLLVVSGVVTLPFEVKGLRPIHDFVYSAPIGIVPIVAAAIAWRAVRGGRIDNAITSLAAGAVIMLALLAAFPVVTTQEWRAPKYLAEEVPLRQTDRDIRIAGCRWMRQSMVFYARREVTPINYFSEIDNFLAVPRPAYVIVPDDVWPYLSKELTVPVKVVAQRFDFFSRRDIIVIANEYATPE